MAKEAELLETKISVKDSIIKKQKTIINNYEEIVGLKEEQLSTSQELSKRLQSDLKKQKIQNRILKMGTGIVAIGALISVL